MHATAILSLIVLLLTLPTSLLAGDSLVPAGWDPALAGDLVIQRLIRVTAPHVKGAHDAEFACVGQRAFIVEHDNDIQPGHGAGPAQYCVLSIVNLKKLAVERTIPLAKSGQAFENETLPVGQCFVPRILKINDTTLRCYFASQPGGQEAVTWYRDFDLRTGEFANRICKARLKTTAGVFDMEPRHFHADAAAQGFTRPAQNHGLYLFDSFKEFDGRRYVAINNFPGKQNALALLHDDFATFEIIGHYNEPQSQQLSESAVNRLPDGTWMAICRNDGGNYHFTTSKDGRTWSAGRELPFVPNGLNSKPTFDKFGGVYYLGWQENTSIQGGRRSVFNVDISGDGQTWQRKYRFESPDSFQYPTFHEHEGVVWLTVTQGHKGSTDRIMFGKLEDVGQFESQAGKATGPKPILYNGIELPLEWPPRHLDPDSTEPMPVPYLQKPPKRLPIHVGRQLFVDDFLIESTDLTRTFHAARKFEGNPVFKAETARELGQSDEGERGEEATTFLGQGGVFWDPAENYFKMFYVAGWRGPLSLATSTDLVHWTRPDLGTAGGNALLPQGLRWTGPQLKSSGSDNCVWLDLGAANPAERIKFLTCWMHVPKDQRAPGFNHSLHVSDGRTWSVAVSTNMAADDYCSFFYNPFRKKWCFSIKHTGRRGRCRYYLETSEFLKGADWSRAVYWTNADRLDLPEPAGRYPGAGDPPQLYSLNAVAYESLMVGMHYIHRGPDNRICAEGKFPKLLDLELGFSRDGFHWHRPDRRGFITGSRTEGSWDRAYLHSTAGVFVVLNDQLVFPYMGTSGIAPSGKRGMYTGGSIGLAMLRRDGFASMDAGEKPGTLTTRPVTFQGRHLFVNVSAPEGELRVEVLSEPGKVLAESKPLTADTTKHRIEWTDHADLGRFIGKTVRLRFHLTRGQLYAFWVTPDALGASNGYVGAGGPAFSGVRDLPPTLAK